MVSRRTRFASVMMVVGGTTAVCLVALHCGGDDVPGVVTPSDDASTSTPDAGQVLTPDTGSPPSDASGDGGQTDAAVGLPPCTGAERGSFTAVLPDAGVVTENWELLSGGGVPGDPWRILNTLRGQGREYFLGAGPGDAPYFVDGGTYPFTIGYGLGPETATAAGTVQCFGSGTARQVNSVVDFRTQMGKSFGRCPSGASVAGEVTICEPQNPLCTTPLMGSLSGVTFDLTSFKLSGSAVELPKFGVNGLGPGLVLMATSDTQPSSGDTKPIHGIFVTNPTAAAPAAIYCLGAGSELHWATASGTSVIFKNVTKLGECGAAAPGTESFRLCR